MKYILLLLLCCSFLVGCTTYTSVTFDTVAVTENPVGTKIGQVDWKEGGILEAAKNGNITRISTVSQRYTNKYTTYYWPLLIFSSPQTVLTSHTEEVIVTGE